MENKAKIFLIENDQDIIKLAVYRMKKMGYDVETAENGLEAIEKLKKTTPDLIFLDINIPVLDGYEVCRRIKNDEKLKEIPVVVLTASVVDIQGKFNEMGANDYLDKPYEAAQLEEKIKKFVGNKGAE